MAANSIITTVESTYGVEKESLKSSSSGAVGCSTRNWETLLSQKELIWEISRHLPKSSLCVARVVCKSWSEHALEHQLQWHVRLPWDPDAWPWLRDAFCTRCPLLQQVELVVSSRVSQALFDEAISSLSWWNQLFGVKVTFLAPTTPLFGTRNKSLLSLGALPSLRALTLDSCEEEDLLQLLREGKATQLTSLCVTGCQLCDQHLVPLQRFCNLRSLSISLCTSWDDFQAANNTTLARCLPAWQQLTHLVIDDFFITQEVAVELAQIPGLSSLFCGLDYSLPTAVLLALAASTSLNDVNIVVPWIPDVDNFLSAVPQVLPALKSLKFSSILPPTTHLSSIANLTPHLTKLDVQHGWLDNDERSTKLDIASLSAMSSLVSLRIALDTLRPNFGFDLPDLDGHVHAPQPQRRRPFRWLKKWVSHCVGAAETMERSRMSDAQATERAMASSPITSSDLSRVSVGCRSLRRLELVNCLWEVNFVGRLRDFRMLSDLTLVGPKVREDFLMSVPLHLLPTMLETLTIKQARCQTQDVPVLFHRLESLTLERVILLGDHTTGMPVGLKHLQLAMPNLMSLKYQHVSPFTDADVASLAQLTRLTCLSVVQSITRTDDYVQKRTFDQLSSLKNLRSLVWSVQDSVPRTEGDNVTAGSYYPIRQQPTLQLLTNLTSLHRVSLPIVHHPLIADQMSHMTAMDFCDFESRSVVD